MQAQTSSSGITGQWWRLAGVAGIVWVVLFIVGAFVLQGGSPSRGDSIEDIRKYFVDDGQKYLVGDYLIGIAFIFFFLPFTVGLRWVIGQAEGGPPIFSWLTVVGAVAAAVMGGLAGVPWGALALGSAKTVDDSTLRLLMDLDVYAFNLVVFPVALFVGSASYVMLRTGVFWRWLGALGLLVALALVVGGAWPIDGDDMGIVALPQFIGFLVLMIWVLITSIALIIRKEPPPAER